MNTYVLPFEEIDKAAISIAGGKGANLGELCKIEGISVPDGFCVTTAAFKRVIGTPAMSELVDRLSLLKMDDRHLIREISGAIREEIRAIAIPAEIIEEIGEYISRLGEQAAYAVRSSATAEDLPTASFAGQQDTFLSIVGKDAIMQHVSRCWASLFTERAVMYRMQNGFDHRKVYLSVVVQKMVFPRAAGILFTADPVTGNRKVSSIDAGFGLGEALVSGLVNADTYKVRDGRIIGKQVQAEQVLTDEQILRLEEIGRIIEAHFGRPQDIEWCLADDSFYIVQSRPITTLFPIPEVNDQANHVYVSVGHQQMMTDPLKPLGLSLRQLTAARPMNTAGGRQFVDVTVNLSSAAGRESLLKVMGGHDPLMKDALVTIIERGFIKLAPDEGQRPAVGAAAQGEIDPGLVGELIRNSEQAIEALKQRMQTALGPAVFELILEDIPHFKKTIFDPRTMKVIMAGIDAYTWINEKMQEWLGEKNVADVLSQSAPNNVTSEMGLDLLNVADAIRPYPEVIGYLEQVKEEDFFDELSKLKGGREARDAIQGYLDRYGMRCAGEIDITKPRWSERPATLVPLLLANVRNFEPGAGKRKFEQGRLEALKKEQELSDRLRRLPDGQQKAEETKRKIEVIRSLIGFREYPKYGIVSRYFVYKQALMKEARRLVEANVIDDVEDIYYLTFEELHAVVRTKQPDRRIIRQRKEEHELFARLTPPRVITSEGEIVAGRYHREGLPAGAIVGLAVSSGVIEGRARVILDMEEAELEEGDILVTTFTDPSWTPLFVSIKGLVAEVGGLMTHGAVIAREYGLPAVVGVEHATRVIRDGQMIRVNGTEGYVEIL